MVLGTARQMIELRQLGGYGGGGNGSETKPCAAHQRQELYIPQCRAVTRGTILLLSPLISASFVSTVW